MKVLEYDIEKIHSETDLGNGYIEVDITVNFFDEVNCRGSIQRKTKTFKKETWEYIKENRCYYKIRRKNNELLSRFNGVSCSH